MHRDIGMHDSIGLNVMLVTFSKSKIGRRNINELKRSSNEMAPNPIIFLNHLWV
jgi:hypothetical protein